MCLIKLIRRLYNQDIKEVADDAHSGLAFEATHKDLGSHTPCRGHKIWSYDFKTKRIEIVTPELIELRGPKGEKIFQKKVMFKPGLLYVSALNLNNAIKNIQNGRFIVPNKK